jgi:hypothetical protein
LAQSLFTREMDVKQLFFLTLLFLAAGQASADLDFRSLGRGVDGNLAEDVSTSQRDGMSLSQAVESIRRRGDVDRIVSAETKVQNGREVHHIRYMTKDGKVRTARVQGRSR